MKFAAGLALISSVVRHGAASADQSSPIGKVLSMISDLQAKTIAEGEKTQKEYAVFAEFCEDRNRDLTHEIKSGKAEVEELEAAIDEQTSTIASLTTKVEEVAAGIATDEADLKAATSIREKEQKDFVAEEKELMETIDMLHRATSVLSREMSKGGTAMLQMKNAGNVVQALSAMVQASLIGSADADKLTAFVQQTQQSSEGGDMLDADAPAAAAYASHSGGIVETLEDLSEQAEGQLDDARKKETSATHNFELMKQSLEDEIRFANKELDEAKKGIATSQEKKSSAEGELETTSKDLAADVESKRTLHHDCMTKSADFEAETSSRGEELKALAEAKKVIEEATSGALAQVSLLQVASRARLSSGADLAHFAAVRLVRDLARKDKSAALAQLASRMSSTLHRGSGDAFGKVRGLIEDMIKKLEAEAEAEANKKAYCDKELKETNEKKADKSDEVEGLSTKLEQAAAKSAKLKEEVAVLQSELANLAKTQAEMDQMRQEQKATFVESEAELEKGIKGLQLAIKVLKEYYAKGDAAHDASEGNSGGIIALIEVCESDFSKNLAEIRSEEETAASEYEETTKANALEKAAKAQDVKYKVKGSKQLDKTAGELRSDRSGVQTELDAVLEYLARLEDQCIAQPETFADRKARREAEIAGLKEALETLESETALLQRGVSRHRSLRGRQGVLSA